MTPLEEDLPKGKTYCVQLSPVCGDTNIYPWTRTMDSHTDFGHIRKHKSNRTLYMTIFMLLGYTCSR